MRSLEAQGGPMSPAEAAAFEANPRSAAAVRLRRWDEEGKIENYQGPSPAHFESIVQACLRH